MIISSGCILIEDGNVLLIYRERDKEKYYVFPGGGIEENEIKEDCIRRECKEELGTGNPEEYDVNRKGDIQIPMFVSIDKFEGLNIVPRQLYLNF